MVKSTIKSKPQTTKADMKNIVQRGEYSFRVRVYNNGEYKTATFDHLKDAQIWRDRTKANLELDIEKIKIKKSRLTQREAKSYTVKQALTRYAKEITPTKKGAAVELTRINKLIRSSIISKSIYLVSPDDVLHLLDEIGGSENNKRKYAMLLSNLFKIAHLQWRMDVKNPVAGEIKIPSNGKPRERRLEVHEIELLQKYLTGEAKYFFELSIETGMRRGEMISLEWKNIDFGQSIALLFDTKNGENRAVPLSKNAINILKCLQVKEDAKYVFSITKSQLRKSWEFARNEAQIPDLRLHDLRHEATSRLFEKGLNVIEAASVTGHKTLSMLKRYTHLNPSEIAKKLG